MKCTGTLKDVSKDWKTGKYIFSFAVNEPAAVNEIDSIQNCEKLSISAVKYRNHRSLDANRMLWACIGDIAAALRADKWDIYLQMLKRYGKYTYICVKPSVVDAIKAQWRECEVIENININGKEAVQMLCYFGSSTYNTKEFSVLLDGVVSEMKEMGLEPPPSQDMKRALEELERRVKNEKHNSE